MLGTEEVAYQYIYSKMTKVKNEDFSQAFNEATQRISDQINTFTKEGYGCEPGRGVRPSASRVRLTGKGAEYGLGEGVAGKSRAVSYSCNGGLCYDESL